MVPLVLKDGTRGTTRELFQSEPVARQLGKFLDVDIAVGDRNGSWFSLTDPLVKTDGRFLYLSLAEVYRFRVCGERKRLRKLSQVIWQVRLLADSGLLALKPVRFDPPSHPDHAVSRALGGIEHLFACRWALMWGTPVCISRPFLASWANVSPAQARTAIVAAQEQGLMRSVGMVPAGLGKAHLYALEPSS